MLNKSHKLLFGIFLLILVDVIWVSSSELTKFLYHEEKFEKPFFCTYFKTSMFALYLLIIGLITPWKESCEHGANYSIMDQNLEDENYYTNHNTLSDSTFIPIQTNDRVSGTESDDSSIRSVRFSKVAEVKEMSSHDATDALMSRLSYTASLRIQRQKTHHKTARTALIFCILWFLANYLFQISLQYTETAMVTLLSTTSSFFTLILAALFPSTSIDKFTLSKLLAVAINITGVVTVTMSDINNPFFSKGAVLAILSAFLYSTYLVFVKRKSDTEEKIDIPLFFGFVGLWNFLLLWPIFFVLNFLKIEIFELPNQYQFAMLFLNGFIGTVISEALWLWGCFLTSSLIGTISMSLQIPISMLFDLLLRKKFYSYVFYIGSVPIFSSLILLSFLTKFDDTDPLLRGCKHIYKKIRNCRRAQTVRISHFDEQQESLIDSNET